MQTRTAPWSCFTESRTGIRTILMLVLLLGLASFHPYPYDNVVTRWALVRQVVEHSTIQIDPYADYTNDTAWSMGHYYCDKAVLLPVLGLIVYYPVHFGASLLGLDEAAGANSASRYIGERCVVLSLFIALLAMLRKSLGNEQSSTPAIAMAALGLGSILLPYSTLFYAHVPAASLLFMSWYFQKAGRIGLADLFGALACGLEFPVLLPFLVLIAYRPKSWLRPWSLMRLALILAGALVPQALHNWAAFGSPFRFGYELESAEAFSAMQNGFFGFAVPSLHSLYMITFSAERGLFFYMPWALAGLLGLFMGGGREDRGFRSPLVPAVLLYMVLFSAYYMPSGGWAFGPRHLIPVIPFLAVGLSRFAALSPKHRGIAVALIIPAVLQALLGLFGEIHQPIHPPDSPVPLPQIRIGLSMLLDGHHSLWLLGTVGTIVLSGLAFLFAISLFKGARFTLWIPAAILFWVALSVPSALANWGGKVDFYRGVLAEQRGEYELAAKYFSRSAGDPAAPPIVGERARIMRVMSQEERQE